MVHIANPKVDADPVSNAIVFMTVDADSARTDLEMTRATATSLLEQLATRLGRSLHPESEATPVAYPRYLESETTPEGETESKAEAPNSLEAVIIALSKRIAALEDQARTFAKALKTDDFRDD